MYFNNLCLQSVDEILERLIPLIGEHLDVDTEQVTISKSINSNYIL